MHFNEVLVIPGCGHFNGEKPYDHGYASYNLVEVDVISYFSKLLKEALEHFKIRSRVLPTFKHPGLTSKERLDLIDKLDFVVHVKAGFFKTRGPHGKNETFLYYGKGIDHFMLKGFEENCREYGKLSSYYHKQQRATLDTEDLHLTKSDVKGVRVELFHLNGPDIDSYFKLLPHLAKGFALTLEEARKLQRSGRER